MIPPALLLWLLHTAVPGAAPRASLPPLQAARQAHDSLEFEECLSQLRRWARAPDLREQERAEAELYEGLCRFNLGQTEEASEHFEHAARLSPTLQLPPGTSPKIRSVFRRSQARAELEPPAPREPPPSLTLTALPTLPSAALPPAPRPLKLGLPIGLGSAGLVATGAFIYLGLTAQATALRANNALYTTSASDLARDARREAVWANVSLGVAVVAAAGAVLSYFLLNPAPPSASASATPPPAAPAALASW